MCRLETGLSLTILILNRNDIWKKENTRRLKLIKNNIKWKDINTKFNMSVRQRRAELHSDIGRWNKKLTVDKLSDLNAIVTLWTDIENEKRAFSLRAWFFYHAVRCVYWQLIECWFLCSFTKKKSKESAQQQKVVQFCIVYLLRKASIFFLNTILDNSVVFDSEVRICTSSESDHSYRHIHVVRFLTKENSAHDSLVTTLCCV